MELSVSLVKGFQSLANVEKNNSMLDVAGVRSASEKLQFHFNQNFFRSNWGPAPALKLACIFKIFRAQICLKLAS